jgi:hypothetical protein
LVTQEWYIGVVAWKTLVWKRIFKSSCRSAIMLKPSAIGVLLDSPIADATFLRWKDRQLAEFLEQADAVATAMARAFPNDPHVAREAAALHDLAETSTVGDVKSSLKILYSILLDHEGTRPHFSDRFLALRKDIFRDVERGILLRNLYLRLLQLNRDAQKFPGEKISEIIEVFHLKQESARDRIQVAFPLDRTFFQQHRKELYAIGLICLSLWKRGILQDQSAAAYRFFNDAAMGETTPHQERESIKRFIRYLHELNKLQLLDEHQRIAGRPLCIAFSGNIYLGSGDFSMTKKMASFLIRELKIGEYYYIMDGANELRLGEAVHDGIFRGKVLKPHGDELVMSMDGAEIVIPPEKIDLLIEFLPRYGNSLGIPSISFNEYDYPAVHGEKTLAFGLGKNAIGLSSRVLEPQMSREQVLDELEKVFAAQGGCLIQEYRKQILGSAWVFIYARRCPRPQGRDLFPGEGNNGIRFRALLRRV